MIAIFMRLTIYFLYFNGYICLRRLGCYGNLKVSINYSLKRNLCIFFYCKWKNKNKCKINKGILMLNYNIIFKIMIDKKEISK